MKLLKIKTIVIVGILCLFLVVILLYPTSTFTLNSFLATTSPWTQTDWSGGSGQTNWLDTTKYSSGDTTIDYSSTPGQVSLVQTGENFTNTTFSSNLDGWPALNTGLTSYWTLDETSNGSGTVTRADSSGSNTLNDGNLTPSAAAKVSNGASFDGTKRLSVTSNSTLQTGDIDFSVSGWFYLNSLPSANTVIMGKTGSYSSAGSTEWMVGITTANKATLRVSNGSTITGTVINTALSAQTWYFFVAWHDSVNNQIGIQLNQVDVSTTNYSNGVLANSTTLQFGGTGTAGQFFNGIVDEVGFWKKVLNASEKQRLYNRGSGITYPSSTTTLETSVTHTSPGSVKVIANIDTNFTQAINVGNINSYGLGAYAYTDGSAITSSDVELYANGANVSTTYTSVGSGWYLLSGNVTGTASIVSYGVVVKSGKTAYLDDFTLKSSSVNGVLTSSIFDTGEGSDWGSLTYNATVPTNTTLSIKVRTDNSSTMANAFAFSSCAAIISGQDLSTGHCAVNQQRYVQYQLTMTSTAYPVVPSLSDISISFSTSTPNNFVQQVNYKLFLNGNTFRFSGPNVYWPGWQQTDGVQLTTQFQIKDAVDTVTEMGGTVLRSFAVDYMGCSTCIETSLGVFNDGGFKGADYLVYLASQKNIKLILPFVRANGNFGAQVFTGWRGVAASQFFSNTQVISDFKDYISYVVNHVNPYTGIAYKDDPTIMAWELGNELNDATPEWEQTVADHIKSIAPKQLVVDAPRSMDSSFLNISSVNIYHNHMYPVNINTLNNAASTTAAAYKVYILEEYGWNGADGGPTLDSILSNIEGNPNITGDLYWSLFPHRATFGYVDHPDGYTLHYPGNSLDSPSDMQTRTQQLRTHAYAMSGISVPSHALAEAPYLHLISISSTGYSIIWRGSTNADTYTIERSDDGGATWNVLQTGVNDNQTPWVDTTITPYASYQYRVKAVNLDGIESDYSNIQSSPENHIQNGSFENDSIYNRFVDFNFWPLSIGGTATASATWDSTVSQDNNHSAKITTTVVDGTKSNVKLYQQNVSIQSTQTYKFSFWAKADSARNINVQLAQDASPNTVYTTNNVSINTSWQEYSFNLSPSASDDVADLNFNLGDAVGNIWIDNVSLIEIAPVTTDNVDNNWHNTNVNVVLTCQDSNSNSCAATYYTTDGTTPTTSSLEGSSFSLSTEGEYTIKYFSIDSLGNRETVKTAANRVKIDKSSPTGSVIINDGSWITQYNTINLNLNATDSLTSVEYMKVSENSNLNEASWETFSETKQWVLSSGNGTKNIYVSFKDTAGNESSIYSDSIVLDTQPPSGSISINKGEAETKLINVDLGISATDELSSVTQMLIGNDPSFAEAIWETFSTTKSWTLTENDGVKTVYIKFKDSLGNISNTYFDDIKKISDTTDGTTPDTNNSTQLPPKTVVIPIGGLIPDAGSSEKDVIIQLVDENGKPIENAEVIIDELNLKGITDSEGKLNLGKTASKEYTALIKYNGELLSAVISTTVENGIIVIKLNTGRSSNFTNQLPVIVLITSLILLLIISVFYLNRKHKLKRIS